MIFTDEKKKRQKRREAIDAAFPDLVMQLILLLNAGMVSSAAFRKVCEMNSGSTDPLFSGLVSIQRRCDESNLSFIKELYAFAKESGSRDLLRFASLAAESAGRGSELAGKLDRERQHLWSSRLSLAKARAAEAGTRLSLPLMMLMISLVIISVAPALMQM
jgi:tight adherence protein C